MSYTNTFKVPLPRIPSMLDKNDHGGSIEKELSKEKTNTRGTQLPSELAIYESKSSPNNNPTIPN